jgi:hypothetical protein
LCSAHLQVTLHRVQVDRAAEGNQAFRQHLAVRQRRAVDADHGLRLRVQAGELHELVLEVSDRVARLGIHTDATAVGQDNVQRIGVGQVDFPIPAGWG